MKRRGNMRMPLLWALRRKCTAGEVPIGHQRARIAGEHFGPASDRLIGWLPKKSEEMRSSSGINGLRNNETKSDPVEPHGFFNSTGNVHPFAFGRVQRLVMGHCSTINSGLIFR